MTKKIVLAGFGNPLLQLLRHWINHFMISGVIVDYDRRGKHSWFYSELEKENVPVITFEELKTIEVDVIIVFNYNRIIDITLIDEKIQILNIHMGLLPLYRGNFANAWSILNGDLTVGYSLHAVSESLDAGEIFYTFKYEIKEGETYINAKNAINKDIFEHLPRKLIQVIDGEIKGTSQVGEQFTYASQLYPEDGIIDWGHSTDDIFNKHIVFARPLGTGLKFMFKSKLIEISKLSKIKNYKSSKGINGAIIFKTSMGSIWVKTQDRAISIDEIIVDGETVVPASIFKIGERL